MQLMEKSYQSPKRLARSGLLSGRDFETSLKLPRPWEVGVGNGLEGPKRNPVHQLT